MESIISTKIGCLKEIKKKLKIDYKEKITVFLYENSLKKIAMHFHAGEGLAYGNTIVEVYSKDSSLDPYHELTHIVARTLGDPPAILSEGLAVYMQKDHKWRGKNIDISSREFIESGKFIPLERLFTFTEIGSKQSQPRISYPETGSFVKFLSDKGGIEKFKALYSNLKNSSDLDQIEENKKSFYKIYNTSVESIEKDWISSFKNCI